MPLHRFETDLAVDPEIVSDNLRLLTAVTNVRDVLNASLAESLYDSIEAEYDAAFVLPAAIRLPDTSEGPINMGELEIRDAQADVFTAHWRANTSSDASQAYSRLVRTSEGWSNDRYFYTDLPAIVLARAVDTENYHVQALLYCFDAGQSEEHFPEAAVRMQEGYPFQNPNTMSIEYVSEQFALFSNPTL